MKTILVALALLVSQPLFAQTCSDKLNVFKESLEEKKATCAQNGSDSNYIQSVSPKNALSINTCISLGESCLLTCRNCDQKSSICAKKEAIPAQEKSGLAVNVEAMIQTISSVIRCIESAVSECTLSLGQTSPSCMAAEENIFRVNDHCDVDITNISIQVRRLQCDSQNPSEQSSFASLKEDLLSEISTYAKKMNAWGKQVSGKVISNQVACKRLHDQQVAMKNNFVAVLMKSSKEARKMKSSVSSENH